MFYLSNLKTAWFGKQTWACNYSTCFAESTSFVSYGWKLNVTIDLQYYVKLRTSFKLDKFENFLIQFLR